MECQRCGRCCTQADACWIVCELTDGDVARMDVDEYDRFVLACGSRKGVRGTKSPGGGTICLALQLGSDGTATCQLEAHKPTQCREWTPGGKMCQYLRSIPIHRFFGGLV